MPPKDLAVYIFLAVTWGLSFLVMLHIVHAFGWIGAVSFRAFVAATTVLLLAKLTRRHLDFSAGWRPFAVVGATTVACQLVGLSFAMPLIGTAMCAILVATIPLFSMVISQLWGLERLQPRTLAGLLIGFCGIVPLVGFPAAPVTPSFILGCLCALLASASAAFGSNYASVRLKTTGSWETTIGAFTAGGLFTLPLLLAVPVPTTPQPLDYLFLVIAGSGMSALTYVLYFRLVTSIGATLAISVEFAVTVVAVIVGAGILGEPLTLIQFAGAAIIVCGCALVLGIIG